MGKLLSALRGRWAGVYRRSSIQLILSLTFTAAAVAGMVFLGMSLFLRFSSATNTQMAQTSQRILSQVNLNLDAYLRGMMRVSDAAYYQVIKGTDLGKEALSQELELLYQSNRDHLVSIAVFTDENQSYGGADWFHGCKSSRTGSEEERLAHGGDCADDLAGGADYLLWR